MEVKEVGLFGDSLLTCFGRVVEEQVEHDVAQRRLEDDRHVGTASQVTVELNEVYASKDCCNCVVRYRLLQVSETSRRHATAHLMATRTTFERLRQTG